LYQLLEAAGFPLSPRCGEAERWLPAFRRQKCSPSCDLGSIVHGQGSANCGGLKAAKLFDFYQLKVDKYRQKPTLRARIEGTPAMKAESNLKVHGEEVKSFDRN
jgi:hypothetical protein